MLRRQFIATLVSWAFPQQPDTQTHILVTGKVTGAEHERDDGYFTIGEALQIHTPPESTPADVLRDFYRRDEEVQLVIRPKPVSPGGLKR